MSWNELDKQQQAYLASLFTLDQAKKADHDDYPRRHYRYDRRPASEWQQIRYEELLQEVRPKGEDVEQILACFVREGLIEREEHNGPTPDHPRIRVTPAGRKMVRDALGITREQFTPAQRDLIYRIVSAGLAPEAEVESAFRSGQGGREQIVAWKKMLSERASAAFRERLQKEQEYIASLTRFEPCAYPGCEVKIEIHTLAIGGRADGNEEEPKPVRFMELIEQLPGWHDERRGGIKVRVPNTRTTQLHLYACSPAHREGVYRLIGQVTLSLDQAEEERLSRIRYPVDASQETLWEVINLVRNTALDMIAQADDQDLVHTKPEMRTIAKQQLTLFLEASNLETLTDNLVRFKALYIKLFVIEYRSGLGIRAYILEKGGDIYKDQQRWKKVYEKRVRNANG